MTFLLKECIVTLNTNTVVFQSLGKSAKAFGARMKGLWLPNQRFPDTERVLELAGSDVEMP